MRAAGLPAVATLLSLHALDVHAALTCSTVQDRTPADTKALLDALGGQVSELCLSTQVGNLKAVDRDVLFMIERNAPGYGADCIEGFRTIINQCIGQQRTIGGLVEDVSNGALYRVLPVQSPTRQTWMKRQDGADGIVEGDEFHAMDEADEPDETDQTDQPDQPNAPGDAGPGIEEGKGGKKKPPKTEKPKPTPGKPKPTPTPGKPKPTPTTGKPKPTPTPGKPKPTPTPGKPKPTPTPGKPKPTPSASKDKPTPSASKDKPTPSASKDKPTPSASKDKPTPSVSEDIPTPSASKEKPTPSASEDIPTPSASEDIPTPSASKDTPTPSASKEEPTPSASEDIPTPSASKDTPTPSASKDRPTPTVSKDKPTPTPSNSEKPSPTSGGEKPTPSGDDKPVPTQGCKKPYADLVAENQKSWSKQKRGWSLVSRSGFSGSRVHVEKRYSAKTSSACGVMFNAPTFPDESELKAAKKNQTWYGFSMPDACNDYDFKGASGPAKGISPGDYHLDSVLEWQDVTGFFDWINNEKKKGDNFNHPDQQNSKKVSFCEYWEATWTQQSGQKDLAPFELPGSSDAPGLPIDHISDAYSGGRNGANATGASYDDLVYLHGLISSSGKSQMFAADPNRVGAASFGMFTKDAMLERCQSRDESEGWKALMGLRSVLGAHKYMGDKQILAILKRQKTRMGETLDALDTEMANHAKPNYDAWEPQGLGELWSEYMDAKFNEAQSRVIKDMDTYLDVLVATWSSTSKDAKSTELPKDVEMLKKEWDAEKAKVWAKPW